MNIKDYVEHELGVENAPKFAEWAWGPSFDKIKLNSIESMNLWNERHGDFLTLTGSGRLDVDIPKMVNLWKEKGS